MFTSTEKAYGDTNRQWNCRWTQNQSGDLETNRNLIESVRFLFCGATKVSFLSPHVQSWYGLITRKERWGLSWRGRLLVVAGALVAAYLFFSHIYPFLAVTYRLNTDVLVVEGWIRGYGIRVAADEFNRGSYKEVYTTGGPENGSGQYVNDYQTSASIGAEVLKKFGVPEDRVHVAASHVNGRERTYNSAIALRDWFQKYNISVASMNVVTEDCHARRTRLLYQKVFGKRVSVGIIAVRNPDYDPRSWWRYSDGVREVIGESIAYLYARLLFFPSESAHAEKPGRISQAYR